MTTPASTAAAAAARSKHELSHMLEQAKQASVDSQWQSSLGTQVANRTKASELGSSIVYNEQLSEIQRLKNENQRLRDELQSARKDAIHSKRNAESSEESMVKLRELVVEVVSQQDRRMSDRAAERRLWNRLRCDPSIVEDSTPHSLLTGNDHGSSFDNSNKATVDELATVSRFAKLHPQHSSEIDSLRTKLNLAEIEVQRVQSKLESAQNKYSGARNAHQKRVKNLEAIASVRQKELFGATRRIQYLINERSKLEKCLKKEKKYCTQLEAKLIELSRRLTISETRKQSTLNNSSKGTLPSSMYDSTTSIPQSPRKQTPMKQPSSIPNPYATRTNRSPSTHKRSPVAKRHSRRARTVSYESVSSVDQKFSEWLSKTHSTKSSAASQFGLESTSSYSDNEWLAENEVVASPSSGTEQKLNDMISSDGALSLSSDMDSNYDELRASGSYATHKHRVG